MNTTCYVLLAALCIKLNEQFTDIKNLLYRVPQQCLYFSKMTACRSHIFADRLDKIGLRDGVNKQNTHLQLLKER